jgi:hypothetical protein
MRMTSRTDRGADRRIGGYPANLPLQAVACSCRVAALALQMFQECQDERRRAPRGPFAPYGPGRVSGRPFTWAGNIGPSKAPSLIYGANFLRIG